MTYDELKQAFLDFAADQSLASVFDTFVRMTEDKVNKRLYVMEMVCRAPLKNPTDGGIRYKLPTDFLGLRAIVGDNRALQYVTPERFYNGVSSATVAFYSIVDGHLLFKGGTSTDSEITIFYYQSIPPLTEANPSNWLATKASDIYLYGCLAESCLYQYDQPRAEVWNVKFEGEIENLRRASNRGRWSGSAGQIREA